MSDTQRINFANMGAADIGFGDSTDTFVQANRLGTDGTIADEDAQYIDSAVIPASTALQTALGLAPNDTIDDAFDAVAAGTGVAKANLTVYGLTRSSVTTATPKSLDVSDPVYGYIPTSAQNDGIDNAADALTGTNPIITRATLQRMRATGSSGKDGYGQVGALAANSTAPTIVVSTTSGNLTGTFTYKIKAYNLSGHGAASSASASTGAIVAKSVTLTMPAFPSGGAMGWEVFRSSDGITWYLMGRAVNGFNFNTTDLTWVDNNAYPYTTIDSTGADTTSSSAAPLAGGRYEFITFTPGTATFTAATTGVAAGLIDIRYHDNSTLNTAWTITGIGANAVNVSKFRVGAFRTGTAEAFLVGAAAGSATFTTSTLTNAVGVDVMGLDTDCSRIGEALAGFGTKGDAAGGTGGIGGYGGATVRIFGYSCTANTVSGTITVTGAAGGVGSGTGAQGGGGGAGGSIVIGMVVPWRDTGTRNAPGGAGGNATGSGGASTVYGGPGGGGGAVSRINCYDKSGATTSVAAGANGSNNASATAATTNGSNGGAHYGKGGKTLAGSVTAAGAGQQFDFVGALNDGTGV